MNWQQAVVLLGFVAVVLCTSGSEPNVIGISCDAEGKMWGCDPTYWNKGNRKECNQTGRIMSWASQTVPTECYIVSAGDEDSPSTSYIPSDPSLPQYMYINIRTVCYGMAFRGLLMYALDKDGTKVGDWNIPVEAPMRWRQPWSNQPGHYCSKSLMHASGMIKPYFARFRFQTPLAGTGAITFKFLIKYGDANEGAFFWPQNKLSLTEAKPSLPDTVYFKTNAGQSCSAFCANWSSSCDSAALALLTTPEAMEKVTVTGVCALPFLKTSVAAGGYADPLTDLCYYGANPSCEATDGQRFCSCLGFGKDNAATSSLPSRLTLAMALAAFGMNKRWAVLAFVMVYLIGFSSAHNWLGTNSRSLGANTISPCKQSRTGLPHAQVGPSQPFAVTWFNAHGVAPAYFTLVPLDDVPKLGPLDDKDRERYISGAPASAFIDITQGKFQKFNLNDFPVDGAKYKSLPYAGRVENTSNLYIEQPNLGPKSKVSFNAGVVYQTMYTRDQLIEDRWVSYDSAEFPFIKSMWRYNCSQVDWKDIMLIQLPERIPYGRYVLQYSWGGYFDCVDIDYVDHQVEHIYGIAPDHPTWSRVDHCTIRNAKQVWPDNGPEEIADNIEHCKTKAFQSIYHSGWGTTLQATAVVASNMTAMQAYAFKKKAGKDTNMTVVEYKFPQFPGAEAIFPIGVNPVQKDPHYTPDAGDPNWNTSTTNNWLTEKNRDKVFCWYAVPPEFTTTTDIYFTTDDPLDPVFYSTCWILNSENVFPGLNTLQDTIATPWKYGERCISCDDKASWTNASMLPIWKTTEDCRNCDLEPGKPKTFASIWPDTKPHIPVGTNMSCDGALLSGQDPQWVWENPKHYEPLSLTDARKCLKALTLANKGTEHGCQTERRSKSTLLECSRMVAEDPECGNYFMWSLRDPCWPNELDMGCICYTKAQGCKGCAKGYIFYNLENRNTTIYEVATTPNPGCSAGVLSEDKTFCCSKECATCTKAKPGNGYSLMVNPPDTVGFCTDTGTDPMRTCDKYSPPCFVTPYATYEAY